MIDHPLLNPFLQRTEHLHEFCQRKHAFSLVTLYFFQSGLKKSQILIEVANTIAEVAGCVESVANITVQQRHRIDHPEWFNRDFFLVRFKQSKLKRNSVSNIHPTTKHQSVYCSLFSAPYSYCPSFPTALTQL